MAGKTEHVDPAFSVHQSAESPLSAPHRRSDAGEWRSAISHTRARSVIFPVTVGGMRNDKRFRVFPHCRFHLIVIDPSRSSAGITESSSPCFSSAYSGRQNGIMLADCRDHMIPRPEESENCRVQCLRIVARKCNPLRTLRVKQLCQPHFSSQRRCGPHPVSHRVHRGLHFHSRAVPGSYAPLLLFGCHSDVAAESR